MGKKVNKTCIYNFGEINVPTSWDDVTLEQFMQLMDKKDVREVISILTGKDINYVNLLPADFVESIISRLVFLQKEPEYEAKNEIIIDNEKYFINVLEKLKFGEYVDVNSVIQSDNKNYAAFLGILCRKEGEEYNDEFIANVFDKRMEMYNKQPITKILPVVAFFLGLCMTSENYSQHSLTEQKQAIDQLLTEIESTVKNGGFRKRYSIWGMKTLWKLRKYKKIISQL